MADPRREAVPTPESDLAALAEITVQDLAVNVPFVHTFCGALTRSMMNAEPK